MKGRILIVDDNPDNLRLLESILVQEGYDVRAATSGELALKAAVNYMPELVLLDITMPTMDGFEVCHHLRTEPVTAEVPVLFLSARTDMDAKLEAFEKGGHDYVTKPFACAEVLARVETHIRLYRMKKELKDNYAQLQKLETLRDNLTHMIIHDMRTPLLGMYGNLLLIRRSSAKIEEETRECLDSAFEAATMLNEMISSLLDVNRLESNQMPLSIESYSMKDIINNALTSIGALSSRCKVSLILPDPDVKVLCDPEITRRIITNLVGNSIKFTPETGEVRVELKSDGRMATTMVVDTGHGIPPEYHTKIFEKFGQVELRKENKKYSTGLGLTFCKLAVEAQGGKIGVESEVGKGSSFWFTIPCAASGN